MRLLIVVATSAEIAPLAARLQFVRSNGHKMALYAYRQHAVTVLTTGVGMVATAAWCSHALATARYDLALNLGICGSYDRALTPGSVVHVVSDCIAELGAEDQGRFIPAHELDLLHEDEPVFRQGCLVNLAPPANPVLDALVRVHGVTVNTVRGSDHSIARTIERWNPAVESMEGAAFMYSCLTHATVFSQIRAVSNFVERRDPRKWRIAEAIENLERRSFEILSSLPCTASAEHRGDQ